MTPRLLFSPLSLILTLSVFAVVVLVPFQLRANTDGVIYAPRVCSGQDLMNDLLAKMDKVYEDTGSKQKSLAAITYEAGKAGYKMSNDTYGFIKIALGGNLPVPKSSVIHITGILDMDPKTLRVWRIDKTFRQTTLTDLPPSMSSIGVLDKAMSKINDALLFVDILETGFKAWDSGDRKAILKFAQTVTYGSYGKFISKHAAKSLQSAFAVVGFLGTVQDAVYTQQLNQYKKFWWDNYVAYMKGKYPRVLTGPNNWGELSLLNDDGAAIDARLEEFWSLEVDADGFDNPIERARKHRKKPETLRPLFSEFPLDTDTFVTEMKKEFKARYYQNHLKASLESLHRRILEDQWLDAIDKVERGLTAYCDYLQAIESFRLSVEAHKAGISVKVNTQYDLPEGKTFQAATAGGKGFPAGTEIRVTGHIDIDENAQMGTHSLALYLWSYDPLPNGGSYQFNGNPESIPTGGNMGFLFGGKIAEYGKKKIKSVIKTDGLPTGRYKVVAAIVGPNTPGAGPLEKILRSEIVDHADFWISDGTFEDERDAIELVGDDIPSKIRINDSVDVWLDLEGPEGFKKEDYRLNITTSKNLTVRYDQFSSDFVQSFQLGGRFVTKTQPGWVKVKVSDEQGILFDNHYDLTLSADPDFALDLDVPESVETGKTVTFKANLPESFYMLNRMHGQTKSLKVNVAKVRQGASQFTGDLTGTAPDNIVRTAKLGVWAIGYITDPNTGMRESRLGFAAAEVEIEGRDVEIQKTSNVGSDDAGEWGDFFSGLALATQAALTEYKAVNSRTWSSKTLDDDRDNRSSRSSQGYVPTFTPPPTYQAYSPPPRPNVYIPQPKLPSLGLLPTVGDKVPNRPRSTASTQSAKVSNKPSDCSCYRSGYSQSQCSGDKYRTTSGCTPHLMMGPMKPHLGGCLDRKNGNSNHNDHYGWCR